MNSFAIGFVLIATLALLVLPRRWAAVPLILGSCSMTGAQGIEIGPFYFSVIRMLVGVGVIRVLIRGERPAGGFGILDYLMAVWAAWALMSSSFHNDPGSALVFRMGLVYGVCGFYFLIRSFCQSVDDAIHLVKITGFVLLPVALEMLQEQVTGRNLFSVFGGVSQFPEIRRGRLRAQGPFAHSILAGTVGAVCFPFMIGFWRRHTRAAIIGVTACLTMVITSGSSGPIMSLLVGVFALFMWRYRNLTRTARWLAFFGYLALDLVMKVPPYYLIARIDLAGGSDGFHRARLIESAIEHLSEWWLAGTDYTRHWMPTGVSWNENHTDLTNHYLQMGVLGGLPLMLLFIWILWTAFKAVGESLHATSGRSEPEQFMIWSLGAALFAQAVTFVSVSYFDQSFVFLYLTIAAIGSIHMTRLNRLADGMGDVRQNPSADLLGSGESPSVLSA